MIARLFLACLALSIVAASSALAQPNQGLNAVPFGQNQGLNQGFNQGNGQANGPNANGGGNNADFDSLIELIVSTVASESWAENGGGEAEIRPYFNGVYADASGVLKTASQASEKKVASQLVALRKEALARTGSGPLAAGDVRRQSKLRCVSLMRLEREIARRQTAGESFDPAMLALAGLQRVEYLFVYPPTDDSPGDIALAGPAGDWQINERGQILSTKTGTAVVRLDDLLTLLRRSYNGGTSFGCTINPRAEALAKTQEYLNATASTPLKPSERKDWLEAIRSRVGTQDIEFMGIAPTTRPAQVIIAADHHMKQIGMGLADSVVGVESYLDSIRIKPGETAPPLGVLRWWFAMNYTAIQTTDAGDAFAIVGPGAKVLSENQLLTERGERIPTGQSDELTQRFANSFTANFAALCQKYPVYGELRNVFDLSLVTTLLRDENLTELAGWKPTLLLDEIALALPKYTTPKTVETIANLRVIRRKHVIAGVSGGVWADAKTIVKAKSQPAAEDYSRLTQHKERMPQDLKPQTWWWDVE